jgi:hypothetical protein
MSYTNSIKTFQHSFFDLLVKRFEKNFRIIPSNGMIIRSDRKTELKNWRSMKENILTKRKWRKLL